MFGGFKFFQERKEWKRFQALKPSVRSIVFYAEDKASMGHFDLIIHELTHSHGREICYLTSEPDDPILTSKNEKIHSFHIGSGTVRTGVFMGLEADVLIMTMPDLGSLHIKRSAAGTVHYIYLFHSMVSTHMIYNKGAFDQYDTILCAGPHHKEEVRATESYYKLPPKQLLEHGYGRLEALMKENAKQKQTLMPEDGLIRVVVAPSWGRDGLLETKGCEIVSLLLQAGFHVTVRPHPFTVKKCPEVIEKIQKKFGTVKNFILETDIRSQESIHGSHCMISDWSGVALEYAFTLERPVLFIDVPKKINNPDYSDINCEPMEIAIRSQIGELVSPNQLDLVPKKIEDLCGKREESRANILKARSHFVYNLGKSGKSGAEHIMRIADKCNKARV